MRFGGKYRIRGDPNPIYKKLSGPNRILTRRDLLNRNLFEVTVSEKSLCFDPKQLNYGLNKSNFFVRLSELGKSRI